MRFNNKAKANKPSFKEKKVERVIKEAKREMARDVEEVIMNMENEIVESIKDIKKKRCHDCCGSGEDFQGMPCGTCKSYGFLWEVQSEEDVDLLKEIEKKWDFDSIAPGYVVEYNKTLRSSGERGTGGDITIMTGTCGPVDLDDALEKWNKEGRNASVVTPDELVRWYKEKEGFEFMSRDSVPECYGVEPEYTDGGCRVCCWSATCSRLFFEATGHYTISQEFSADDAKACFEERLGDNKTEEEKPHKGLNLDFTVGPLEKDSVGFEQLKDRCVGYKKLAHRAVRKEHLSSSALEKVRDYLVASSYIGERSVKREELAYDSILPEHLTAEAKNDLVKVARSSLQASYIRALIADELKLHDFSLTEGEIELEHLSNGVVDFLITQIVSSEALEIMVDDMVQDSLKQFSSAGKKSRIYNLERAVNELEKKVQLLEQEKARAVPSSEAIQAFQQSTNFAEMFLDRMERLMVKNQDEEEYEEYEEEEEELVPSPDVSTLEVTKTMKLSGNFMKLRKMVAVLLILASLFGIGYSLAQHFKLF